MSDSTLPCNTGRQAPSRKAPILFHGWLMILTASIGMALIYGARHSFSVFYPAILHDFGWKRGDTALMYSLNILVYGLAAPFAGSLGDRWQPRRVLQLGLLILFLALAACGLSRKLWHFYLLFGVAVPLGTALSGWPLLSSALANWFYRKRGMAMGLGQMGAGFSFTFGFFVDWIIARIGWRLAYVVTAVILLAVMSPVYHFLYCHRPEEKGLRAFGAGDEVASAMTQPGVAAGLRSCLGDCRLWFLVASEFFYWGIGIYLILAHQISLAIDAGYSSVFAASVFSLFGVFMVAGQFASTISDWIGREKTFFIAASLSMGSLIALYHVRDTSTPYLLYAYASGFGLGAGLSTPTLFTGAADIFHGQNYGAVAGCLLCGMGLGAAVGPWL
ncbi:MAG: MFS transporter, partial [Deltaproteobacteria bacterium]|nr:MFS transporter [Deltaproteobacteria bacterium]